LPTRIISNSQRAKTRVGFYIKARQNGGCRHCQNKLSDNDQIVSSGTTAKYYHMRCAEKLNII
jgi:hypothetical protein